MLYLNVKGVIDNEQVKAMVEFWGDGGMQIFTVETLNKFLADNPDDNELTLNIDCDGGSVEEGLKIYDALRMSGRTLHTNIAGACHSMAVVILLAAPVENRSGNTNLRALIHRVYAGVYMDMSAEDCLDMADRLLMEEDAILDIYADRTGGDRKELQDVMRSESMHNAESLLALNFISKVNSYNTNQFFNAMTKSIKSAYAAFVNRREAYRKKNQAGDPVIYEYKDAEGNVVFTSEVAPEDLAEGSPVTLTDGTTSGTFLLDDDREVTITDGVVESIDTTETDTLEERVEELETLVEEATNLITEQQTELTNLRNELARYEGSTHSPKANRYSHVPSKKDSRADNRSTQDIKEQAKINREKAANKSVILKKS